MSIEINTIIIGGNLARDVELRELPSGQKVAVFAVASNRTYMAKGEKKSEVVFIDIDVWGAIGENCAKYLQKGSPVVVTGRIKQDAWQTQAGEKRTKIKVVASNVQFLSASKGEPAAEEQSEYPSQEPAWEE